MEIHLWSSAGQVAGTAVSTSLVYIVTLLAVRVAGRRTTSQLSAFDTLVTVAIGSAVAATALPPRPSLADGAAALATLLALQVGIGALRQRDERFQRLVDFAPVVVARNGEIVRRTDISSAQLTAQDVLRAVRQAGLADLDGVRLLVLEPTGRFSALGDDAVGGHPWAVDG